jgi:Spy/CpxP family protein refolding chaperone
MNTRSLLMIPAVVALVLGTGIGVYAAKDQPGVPSSVTAVKPGPPPSADQSDEPGKQSFHRHSLQAIAQRLGLTDEQKNQFRSLYVGYRDHTRKARMELRSVADEKKTMLMSGKVDRQKLATLDEQVVKLTGDVLGERLKVRRDRLGLLSPEQRSRAADWRMGKPFHSKMKGAHGRGRHSFPAMAKHLGLSEDQTKQIRNLYIAYRDRTHKTRLDLMSLKDQKSTMLLSEKTDPQKLAQIDDQIVKLVTDKIREKLQYRRDRLALLTPEQMGRMADWKGEKAFRSRMERRSPEKRDNSGRRG